MMELVLQGLAIFTFVYLMLTLFECLVGFNLIQDLMAYPLLVDEQLPTISIIFTALNEEDSLEKSLHSLLTLHYPRLEILAVNDRSTDKTGSILDEMKKKYANLCVFHIEQLPNGWLGKNHALHLASREAKGEWLLFTDADVSMRESVISHAISYAIEKKLDHLTIYENHLATQFWLKILLLGSYLAYSVDKKPWRVRYAWSKRYVGHGAFNLVNKAFYLKCGGHQAIAMECLDDMKLGYIIKKNGGRQDIANGKHFVEREWYRSFGEMVDGLKKNSFAHFNFNFSTFLLNIFFAIIIFIWPCIAAICFNGSLQWINVLNVLLSMLLTSYIASRFRLNKRFAFFYPVAMGTLFYTVWNAVIATYRNKGITWRNTFYSLESLVNKNDSK